MTGAETIKKNVPWHILAPSAVACDNLHLRASAHHWHIVPFYLIGSSRGISYQIKKPHPPKRTGQNSRVTTFVHRWLAPICLCRYLLIPRPDNVCLSRRSLPNQPPHIFIQLFHRIGFQILRCEAPGCIRISCSRAPLIIRLLSVHSPADLYLFPSSPL